MERHILEQYTDVQREEKDIAKRIERLEDEIQKMEMNGYMVADSVTCGKKERSRLEPGKYKDSHFQNTTKRERH